MYQVDTVTGSGRGKAHGAVDIDSDSRAGICLGSVYVVVCRTVYDSGDGILRDESVHRILVGDVQLRDIRIKALVILVSIKQGAELAAKLPVCAGNQNIVHIYNNCATKILNS